jgi:hypothetical protein
MISEGIGTHLVHRAVVAGLIMLVLGGSDALAARNCVSNTGKGRSARVKSLKVVGLTSDGRLLCFPAKSADKAEVVGSVTGLGSADSALIGIDFRAQDGKLYGVGNGGGVYNLGLDPDPAAGFDIYSVVVNGAAVDNLGYAVLNQGASSGFYSVSFQTGQATLLDEFKDKIVDIALPPNQN